MSQIVHDYGDIDPEEIWSVLTTELGALVAALEQLFPETHEDT